jgi:hypothetical protein
MSKNNTQFSNDYLLEDDTIQRTIILTLSFFGIFLYLLSLLVMICYIKKIVFIKSKSFSFILLNSLTNLFDLMLTKKELLSFKSIILFISYLFQFHLIISSIDRMLSGKQIFKSEKDYSLKKLIYIEIVLPLLIFPYDKFFKGTNMINFIQNISIIILLICFYEYVKNKIEKVIQYLNENNKDNIEIAYMEPDELSRIYTLIRKLWLINFIITLIFYIIKFFDILLKKIEVVHYLISILLIILKEFVVFLSFSVLTIIVYLLNKSYSKGQIIQTEEEESNFVNGEKIKFEGDEEENGKINKKEEAKNMEIELEDINIERNKQKEEYKNIDKSQNEDNIIEIDNLDISNGKENKNNEEEKLDEEDENLKLNHFSKETDKLK